MVTSFACRSDQLRESLTMRRACDRVLAEKSMRSQQMAGFLLALIGVMSFITTLPAFQVELGAKEMVFRAKKGFVIRSPVLFHHSGTFQCRARFDGRTDRTDFMVLFNREF